MQLRVFKKSLFACSARENMKDTKLKSRQGKKRYFRNAQRISIHPFLPPVTLKVYKSEMEQAFLKLIIPQN